MNWIPVTERLPDDDQTVLCFRDGQEGNIPIICWYNEDEKAFVPISCQQDVVAKVDYWIEIPKAPK